MSVKITVGLGLDGPRMAPHDCSVGELRAGCVGTLQWLEGQLGLELPAVGFTERVLQYLARLKAADSQDRFYHQSLQVDAIGVARQLLSWRDTWYLAGWQGGEFNNAPKRLKDMAAVETLDRPPVALNEGQRVRRVLRALDALDLPLQVTTLDPVDEYPALWRRLLTKLDARYQPPHTTSTNKQSDLKVLQDLLLSGEVPPEPVPLKGDGSLLVLKAPSRATSATWLAHYCRNLWPSHPDYSVGLLCDGESDDLDVAFAQAGNARLGVSSRSPWRPVFQVLPLAMELIWSPLNPSRLLEFLSHPVGPLPRRVRQRLAECVAEFPGMGGDTWNAEIANLLEAERDRYESEQDAKKAAAKLEQDLAFWLEHERYPAHPGAPLELVKQRASGVSDWLAGMLKQAQDNPDRAADVALYQRVQNQVSEFSGAVSQLQAQGEEAINADDLRRLMKSVRGSGAVRPDVQSECLPGLGKLMYAASPAACIGEVDSVIWWGADQGALPKAEGWTEEELAALLANGVDLQPLDARITWHAATWARPALSAKKQLIFIVHDDAGSRHPLFDQINALVEPLPADDLLPWMQGRAQKRLQHAPDTAEHDRKTLPPRQRCWTLPKGVKLPPREAESFSSLESFIYGPYLWVLRHTAGLRAGSLLAVSDDNRLKGNLAHRLFEDFFATHKDVAAIKVADVVPWSQEHMPQLLEQLGAMLLMPGRAADRERFMADSASALERLVKHLQAADVVTVAMEHRADGQFVGGKMRGALDLLATKADGTEAVVDIKWSNAKYKRTDLKESRYLQLAIYAQLRRQLTGKLPAVGYFIIASQDLMMLDSTYFPEAESVVPANEESLSQFWLRFENSWKQRRKQLDKGLVEVNVSGTELLKDLLMDETALPYEEVYERFSEFGALVGWEAEA